MTDLNREFLQSEEGARLAKKVPMRRFANRGIIGRIDFFTGSAKQLYDRRNTDH